MEAAPPAEPAGGGAAKSAFAARKVANAARGTAWSSAPSRAGCARPPWRPRLTPSSAACHASRTRRRLLLNAVLLRGCEPGGALPLRLLSAGQDGANAFVHLFI